MGYYNVLTENIENLEEIFTKKFPKNMKFLSIAPHSGENIPFKYLKNIDRFQESWKKEIDYSTDKLYDLTNLKGGLLTTKLHRNFIDLNRSRFSREGGMMKQNGFDGEKILLKEYDSSEKNDIFFKLYVPFYTFLNSTMFDLKERYGSAFLLNGHSMEKDIPNSRKNIEFKERPDFCVGTLDGTSATKEITDTFVNSLIELVGEEKLCVEEDYPFKGEGNLSKIYSFPKKDYNTLLLEVNQRLYVDEDLNVNYESLDKINEMISKTMEETLKVIRK